MNCAHSARSFPSGGRRSNNTSTTKMGTSARMPRRNCPEMRRPHTIMSADNLESYAARGSGPGSRQNLSHDARRSHAGQLLLQALKGIVELVMVETQQVKHRRM